MRHAIRPALRVGLGALDGADIVGLAVVVPGNNLYNVDHGPVYYEGRPSLFIGPIVREVYPLAPRRSISVIICNADNVKLTFLSYVSGE